MHSLRPVYHSDKLLSLPYFLKALTFPARYRSDLNLFGNPAELDGVNLIIKLSALRKTDSRGLLFIYPDGTIISYRLPGCEMIKIPLLTESYSEQNKHLPRTGHHILAQFDAESIIVYQAFNSSIGAFAIEHRILGGSFSYNRMSWIKPSFLWMMYRSGWGTKANQEITLALRINRVFFDSLLACAVPSTWDKEQYQTEYEWSQAVRVSSVRIQWDPDHLPAGGKLDRRVIQLGLRGTALERFGKEELLEVIDLTAFVEEQRTRMLHGGITTFEIPQQRIYLPKDRTLMERVGLSKISDR